MSTYEISKMELKEACNRLVKAIKASENEKREVSEPLTHKGKTLYHVNRERVHTVKMTVGY